MNKGSAYNETLNITKAKNLLSSISTVVGERLGLITRGKDYQQKSHGGKEGLKETSMN